MAKQLDQFRTGDYVQCKAWPNVSFRIGAVQNDLVMVRQRFIVTDVCGGPHEVWTAPFFLAGSLDADPAPG